MNEGYSREAFDANEKKIDEVRETASLKPFGGRPRDMINVDPADVISAKMAYMSGKQERKRLLDLAHDEALVENSLHTEGPKTKIGDWMNLKIETESGNTYIIQRNKQGDKYLVANFNTGTIGEIDATELSEVTIIKGKSLSLGSYGHTSPIKNALGYK